MNLVSRLREEARQGAEYGGHPEYELLVSEAADRIEQLAEQYSQCQQFIGTLKVEIKELCEKLDALDAVSEGQTK